MSSQNLWSRALAACLMLSSTALAQRPETEPGAPADAAHPTAPVAVTPTDAAAETPAAADPPPATDNRLEQRLADVEAALSQQRTENAGQQAEIESLRTKAEEAELAALLSDDSMADVEEDRLRFYGFADFGMDKFFFSEPDDDGVALLRPTRASTFVFGNLNFYVDAVPAEKWRALFEARLTVAPHGELSTLGPPLGGGFERIDTTAFDFASPSAQAQLRLGGLFVERGWVEWSHSNLLRIRTGLFLNPFGIWNVDHGSPTLIGLMLPTFVASQMIPTRLMGIEAHGSVIRGAYQFGYHAHVSNGRGPTDYDLTEDKALGARLFVAHEGMYGRTVVGLSGYRGTYTDMEKKINIAGENIFDWTATVDYRELIGGADLAVDYGNARFRTEGVLRRVDYDGDKRERIFSPLGGEWYMPDRTEYAGYALLSYRIPWLWDVEPYAEYEVAAKSFTLARYAGNARASRTNIMLRIPSVGLNVPLSTATMLKTQVAVLKLMEDRDLAATRYVNVPVAFTRLVTSF